MGIGGSFSEFLLIRTPLAHFFIPDRLLIRNFYINLQRMRRILLLLCLALGLTQQVIADSLDNVRDSLVAALEHQLHQMKLNEIVLQEQLAQTGESRRQDSLRRVERQQRIDSLRNIVPGHPVVVGGDTLFVLYANRGGVTASKRAEEATR